jgi:hypothetical protein
MGKNITQELLNELTKQIIESIDYFINKDYTQDVMDSPNSKKIIMGIDRLRNPVKDMNEENKKKSMGYIQNLTKLCTIYGNMNGGF